MRIINFYEMSVKPYPIQEEESSVPTANEPTVQEAVRKRRYPMAEAMKSSITLEELDSHLTDLIHRHYHPEA